MSKIVSLNPSKNFEIIGEVAISSYKEIDDKVLLARKAFKEWAGLEIETRNEYLEKLYKAFENNKEALTTIAAREMGFSVSTNSIYDFDAGLRYFRGYLDNALTWLSPEIIYTNAHEIHYQLLEPAGVVGISIPWNYPFCNFIWSVMQNLIVGNTVVFKHSENCALTAQLLERIMQSVNLPIGVVNAVYGNGPDTGEYLMQSAIDFMYFTGSTAVGKHLYKRAAQNFVPIMLELGGSAPGIIFENAELNETLESIYNNRFINNGQTCDGLKRLIVHKSIFLEVVTRLKKIVESKIIGEAEDEKTDLGPLVTERQLVRLEEQVQDALAKGAKIITGGKRPSHLQGAYYEPTILTNVTFDMKVWTEEVFGPVLPVVPFESQEEALHFANDTEYGLGGYIYTQDKDKAFAVARELKTGNISINNANYNVPNDPFGGYKNSGIGREHGKVGFTELCHKKVVAYKK